MLQSLARQALRQRLPKQAVSKRFNSSSSSENAKKAQDALASAQATASRVLEGVQKALGPLGEKAGNMLGSYKQPLLYNLAVGKELVKLVYRREGLAPPSLSTVRDVYATLASQLTSPAFVANVVKSGELGRIGVYGLQAYGIFKIGEIVGRRSLVGYKLE